MEPTIYKPGIYKTPGVYKGAGGIYKGRGVYNDGAGGGDVIFSIGGRDYTAVKIGNIYYTTENLDLKLRGIGIGGGTTTDPHAWYYNNDEAEFGYNGYRFGLLYNQSSISIINGYLYNGLRVMTKDDAQNILDNITDVKTIKTNEYWQAQDGTNETGLSIVPSGYFGTSSFNNIWVSGIYRTSTETDSTHANTLSISNNNTITIAISTHNVGLAVRICKDA